MPRRGLSFVPRLHVRVRRRERTRLVREYWPVIRGGRRFTTEELGVFSLRQNNGLGKAIEVESEELFDRAVRRSDPDSS